MGTGKIAWLGGFVLALATADSEPSLPDESTADTL